MWCNDYIVITYLHIILLYPVSAIISIICTAFSQSDAEYCAGTNKESVIQSWLATASVVAMSKTKWLCKHGVARESTGHGEVAAGVPVKP